MGRYFSEIRLLALTCLPSLAATTPPTWLTARRSCLLSVLSSPVTRRSAWRSLWRRWPALASPRSSRGHALLKTIPGGGGGGGGGGAASGGASGGGDAAEAKKESSSEEDDGGAMAGGGLFGGDDGDDY